MNSYWRDRLNLLSNLSAARLSNAFKVTASYYYSRQTGLQNHWGLPFSMSVEPTTSCNLRCPECPSGLRSFTRPTGMLKPQLFKDIIDQAHEHLIYLTFYFQGEPYLNPNFLDLVYYAAKKGIYTATSTNAHYLNDHKARKTVESGLDSLIISIDGSTQETYQAYRVGGKLERVLEGAANVVKWKKELKSATPHVVFQFLVVGPNEHQIDQVKALAQDLGIDRVTLKTAQIYDFQDGSPLIPENQKYSRYKKNGDGRWHIKNKLENHCWKMWHSCVVTWDGKVVPCCFDKDARYVMGDLSRHSLAEIWNNERYRKFRASLMHSRKEIDMCRNCTEGTKVFA